MATTWIAGYSLSSSTTVSRESLVNSDISDAGTMRLVDLGGTAWWTIGAVYDGLSEAEAETLTDWLVTYETTELAMVVGVSTYNGFINPRKAIKASPYPNAPELWSVKFEFVGDKQ